MAGNAVHRKRVRLYEAGSPLRFSTSRAAGHVPRRTCVGCRRIDDQAALLRLVGISAADGVVVRVDEHRRMSGRGAWLHPDPACLASAAKRRAFNRAFRGPADTHEVAEWFQAQGSAPTGSGSETVQPESGSAI